MLNIFEFGSSAWDPSLVLFCVCDPVTSCKTEESSETCSSVSFTQGPQRDNRPPTQGPRGPPWIFGFGENPCKTCPWKGLGGNCYTQRVPGSHTNHSPRKKSGKTTWGTNPSTISCFSGPLFGPQKGPGALLGQDVGSGLQDVGSGLQK